MNIEGSSFFNDLRLSYSLFCTNDGALFLINMGDILAVKEWNVSLYQIYCLNLKDVKNAKDEFYENQASKQTPIEYKPSRPCKDTGTLIKCQVIKKCILTLCYSTWESEMYCTCFNMHEYPTSGTRVPTLTWVRFQLTTSDDSSVSLSCQASFRNII